MKQKKVKKLFALLMAASMTAGLMTGCGNATGSSAGQGETSMQESGEVSDEDSDSADSASESSAPEDETTADLDISEEVELVMYVVSDRPAGQDVVDENLNKLLKEKLNCTLKINWLGWAEYAQKYPLLFSSGEEFDIAYASTTWLNALSMARRGAFMNLDELWPKYAPQNFARQSESALQLATVDGHYYLVPTLLGTYGAYGPIYRTDLMEGTEWDGKMETFEDIEEYCDIIKETHPEIEPVDQYSAAPEWGYLYMLNKGYACPGSMRYLWFDVSSETPVIKSYYEMDETVDLLAMMKRWNEKEFFTKSALSDTDSAKTQNGKAALKIHNVDNYNGLVVQHPEWGFKYSNFVKDVAHITFTTDSMVISNTSKNPERALALWELITNDQEVYNAFYYGVEGVTYNINEKNEFEILDTDLYSASAMWAARTPEFNLSQVGSADDYDSLRQEFEDSIQAGVGAERFMGFTVDTSSFETELAACNNVWQQYWWPMELGYTDWETALPEYEEKMKAAGIDKVVEEVQKQMDEYMMSLN